MGKATCVVILIISCSSENIELIENYSRNLIRTEQKIFENDELSERIVTEFSSNKPIKSSFYDEDNVLTYIHEWNYSNGDLLLSEKGYLPNGVVDYEKNINYDNANRVRETKRTRDNNITSTSFIYNNDNTVVSETNVNGNISTKVFEIGSRGVINKEIVNNNVRVSVEYDDDFNVISLTSFLTTYNYLYQESGAFPFSYTSVYGDNLLNAVLISNSLADSAGILGNKLISKIASHSSEIEYLYTLNEFNLPITRQYYSNGELFGELYFTYE
ncbi:hypothetical protein SAMN04489761_1968 [Tenacibaculum sp. MAR_2009_124]|uniref:hypothetical protein n=1 Tax=Tenacibaculum sp. MAR_2009_124 TaxID=1250059 RepID=UPI000895C92D|nr:hypothetical protein [Tenacibaculum sp. MAR_2009_124]SEB85591.1 hypothetical protein SAMN04489761_1968 [Tenacibaculum sp. MAR_2009_124]